MFFGDMLVLQEEKVLANRAAVIISLQHALRKALIVLF